jgi:hypothetical protein
MHKFLSTKDIARLSGCSSAQVLNWWKAGLIPARNANAGGKQLRLIDSPELQMWCAVKSKRLTGDELMLECIKAIIAGVTRREFDRGADPPQPSDVVGEVFRQLNDSDDPVQLFKKWARAVWEQRFEDLPHVP